MDHSSLTWGALSLTDGAGVDPVIAMTDKYHRSDHPLFHVEGPHMSFLLGYH
jgi:hypothetical protein